MSRGNARPRAEMLQPGEITGTSTTPSIVTAPLHMASSSATNLVDEHRRKRIGPWEEGELPRLKHFEADRNFVVRASAGSGKTTALVARMVALTRLGADPGDMAAITFTRKAAGEMRQRFFRELRSTRAQLDKLIAGDGERQGDPSREELHGQRQNVQKALNEIQRCFIGTIHSFCARILREHAIEVGLPPDFVAGLDDQDERQLRERVWHEYLEEVWTEDPEAIEHLDALGIDVGELEDTFGKLCGNPDLKPYTDGPDAMPTLQEAAREACSFVETYAPYVVDPEPDANAGRVSVALRSARLFLDHRSLDDPATRADFLKLFETMIKEDTRSGTDTERRGDMRNKGDHWTSQEVADQLDNEGVPEFVGGVVEPALAQWRAYGHRQIMEFLEPAVRRYRNRRRDDGRLTFVDLLVETRRLLRENPSVRESLQSRYRRILVDEFQDTDPIQAQILFYLTGENTEEKEDWTQCSPRPGSLFIVGDDQQSIYGFRRADMRVFSQVKELISDPEADNALQLESNFRSLGPVCDWCDAAFGSLLSEGVDEGIQAAHQPFSPTRTVEGDGGHIRILDVPGISWNPAEDIARRNAKQIAQHIANATESESPFLPARQTDGDPVAGDPGDFMILTRNKGRLSIFAEELAARDVPYDLTGGQDLGDSTELRALVDLMTCVRRPDDPVAQVAFLRGALAGFSDDDLYQLKTAGFRFGDGRLSLSDEVRVALDGNLAGRTEQALATLREAGSVLRDDRPASAIGQIIDRTGLFGRALDDSVHGSLHAGRLSRLVALVRKLDHNNLHWTEILDELERLVEGETDADGLTLDAGTGGAVQLLNVHQAKGLEAPVVILADPYHGRYPRAPDQYVDREGGGEGRMVRPVYDRGKWSKTLSWAPLSWEEGYQDQATREQAAEERRLQYVAATRAEDCLIVSRYEKKEEEGFWANLYPHLEGMPQLDVDSENAQTEVPSDQKSSLPIPEFRQVHAARKKTGSEKPTYKTQSVTDTLGDHDPSEGRYGRTFGRAVHDLLEQVVNEPASDLEDEEVRGVLRDQERESDEQIEAAQEMVRRFRESDLFDSVRSADTVLTEIPLCGSTAREGLGEERSDVLLTGTVDLVYYRDDEWHLVDYKTHVVGDDLEALVQHYEPQVQAYARLWAQQTNEKIQSACLWFADTGESVSVSL